MTKIKAPGQPPVVSPSGVELGEEEERAEDAPALEPVEVDTREDGPAGVSGEGREGPVSEPVNLPPPVPGGSQAEGVPEAEGTVKRGGSRFLKRLDDKLDVLLGKITGTRFRPGATIELLRTWESIGPLGESGPLMEIARSPNELRYPLLAHLIGVGGTLALPGSHLGGVVELEGLGNLGSRRFLPPVFRFVTRRVRRMLVDCRSTVGDADFFEKLLRPIEDAWLSEIDLLQLEEVLGSGKNSWSKEELVVVRAGWRYPIGHAVGLVYGMEGEKHILYACNTGEGASSGRTIEKMEIRDLPRFREFLRGNGEDSDSAREIWGPHPEKLGLVPAGKNEQIPTGFSRSSQKRGNCPIAARKSCQLAMLWSLGRRYGLTPVHIKTLYKMTTTAIRMEGVGVALQDGDPEFLSRVFVSLLSKWDRPDCRRLAYEVSDRLLESEGLSPVSGGVTGGASFKSLGKSPHVDSIKLVVRACELDLRAKDSQGMSLLDYAKDHNNSEVVNLLRKLGV